MRRRMARSSRREPAEAHCFPVHRVRHDCAVAAALVVSVKAKKDYALILAQNGLPPAPATPIDARYIAANGDWWVKTAVTWYWMRGDAQQKTWVPAPNGPP